MANDFVRSMVGSDYFITHFALQQAKMSGDYLKATYAFNYPPFVAGHAMTLFLNLTASTVADNEVSTILLTPQSFNLNADEAVIKAIEQGLKATGSYQIELRLGPETNNRFAWWVTGPVNNAAQAPPGSLLTVALDAETGQVYVQELVGIDAGH
jgi:hypothetical protein